MRGTQSQPRPAPVPYLVNPPQMISELRKRILRANPLRIPFQQTIPVITRWLRRASPAHFHPPLFLSHRVV